MTRAVQCFRTNKKDASLPLTPHIILGNKANLLLPEGVQVVPLLLGS